MTTRTLNVQNYVLPIRNGLGLVLAPGHFVVTSYTVETSTDERGVEYVSVDGVRFGLSYEVKGQSHVCNLDNPRLLPNGRAYEIALKIRTSGTGHNAPSNRGAWLS